MERLEEEGNAAFKAGRLNEADGSPGRMYGIYHFPGMPLVQKVGEAT